jgi:hypothetical protein
MKLGGFPLKAPGDFYAGNGLCFACTASEHEDPDVMGSACDFRRQPETPEEKARALRKRWNVYVAEFAGVQVGGADCSPVGRECSLQIGLIDVLIDAGASPERTLDALICRNLAAAEHLLERGAGLTLATAVCLGRWADVTYLARTASAEDRQIALAAAALNGKPQGLAALIDVNVDLDAYSTGFYTHATALHHAVCSGSLDAVKVLVEAGAELGTRDKAYQATPLGWAEHAQGEPEGDERAKQYADIAAYPREKGAKDEFSADNTPCASH